MSGCPAGYGRSAMDFSVGDKVRLVTCDDPNHEARFVAEEIRDQHNARVAYRDMAVL